MLQLDIRLRTTPTRGHTRACLPVSIGFDVALDTALPRDQYDSRKAVSPHVLRDEIEHATVIVAHSQ